MITIKWFKHETDAANSEKLAILQQQFGFAGIGRWWRLLETIAAKMDKTDKCSVEYPKNKWRELLGYDNNTHLARYLDHLATVGLLHCHDTGTSMSLSIPNLLNKRDNYTKDLVVTTKKLPSKEVEVEVEVEEDNTFSSTSDEVRLSELLLSLIIKRNANHKMPNNIQTWAKEIDKMIRIDKRTVEDIENIIKWCQVDTFWQNNILSAKKLREKFDQLKLKSQTQTQGGGEDKKKVKCEWVDELGPCTELIFEGKKYCSTHIFRKRS